MKTKESKILSERDLQSIRHWISRMKIFRHLGEEKKKVVAEKALHLNYKMIGSGKTRIVYDLGNGYVVKVALSKRGLTSNWKEYDLYNRCSSKLRKHLCPVIEYGKGWIIMKNVKRMAALTEKYERKLPRLRRRFSREGITARSLRSKNLALSKADKRIIVIDYGSFRYDGS
ncbi:hypothetical protein [Paenibacillus sp. GCM10027626]|uniref:hypothetical protein n=1 Tax=Paenibacillus sp. GCM10027626 TaxID=3273411 RepID=UPI00363DA1D5